MTAARHAERHYGRWRRHVAPVIVWVAVLGGVVWLFQQRTERAEWWGIGRAQPRQVAAITTGRLRAVAVALFDVVEEGQVLAVLEGTGVRAQLAIVQAEVERLQAELGAKAEQLRVDMQDRQDDWSRQARTFTVDVERNRLRRLELRAALAADEVQLDEVKLELKATQDLLAQEAVPPYALQRVQVQHDALAEKIRQSRDLLAQAEQDITAAEDRAEVYLAQRPTPITQEVLLNPLRKAITVQERRLGELRVNQANLNLHAPLGGKVTEVFAQAGETVLAGDPVCTISTLQAGEVIAFAPEPAIDAIEAGQTVVEVSRLGALPRPVTRAVVAQVGSSVEQLPLRLWVHRDMPQWGRPFLMKIPREFGVAPGERVAIRKVEADQP